MNFSPKTKERVERNLNQNNFQVLLFDLVS